MKWLLRLCPAYRALESGLYNSERVAAYYLELAQQRAATNDDLREDLTLTRKARDEQARTILRLNAELASARDARDVVHADLVSASDVSARFRQMWEENTERAAKAERVAAFYRCAFGNVRRAVDNAVTDGVPA